MGRATMLGTTVFELAKHDHGRHLRLIEEVAEAADLGARARRTARLSVHMRRHAKCEHASLLSVLLIDEELRPLARRAVAAHLELERLAGDIGGAIFDSLEFDRALGTYISSFAWYVRFEERELYPAASAALGPERSKRLAARFALAREHPLDDHRLAR